MKMMYTMTIYVPMCCSIELNEKDVYSDNNLCVVV